MRQDGTMSTPRKYPPALRDGTVRVVLEAQKADDALLVNQALVRIAPRMGVSKEHR